MQLKNILNEDLFYKHSFVTIYSMVFIHHIVAYKLLPFPIYFSINEKNNLISLYDTMMNNWY